MSFASRRHLAEQIKKADAEKLTRDDLIDELQEAIYDAHDIDSNSRTYAKAAIACLEKLGLLTFGDDDDL